ncbi:hypothetical protein ES332_A02G017000v1 [Gossypium tomentosum]|uniref:Bacterial surface antigen (D15) domain-containing protein n=1 Tax=Gossypium tomentosum TaxID=34277 RepID=A0A5D2RD11_GOSTO|nr:hypothetical protein ES332_A02G017000v1 [Gossypium tomentosum]
MQCFMLFILSHLLCPMCSFAYSHRNLFGRNQKLNISLERGQIDSIFCINYTDPWIEGDDKRTSRTIIIFNSRTPGTLVHGNQHDNSSLSIGRVTASIEFSRALRPKLFPQLSF